jgi:hypothetical protein
MDPDSTTPRNIFLVVTIILGCLLECGVFFLSLVFSAGYFLASSISLAVLALLIVALLVGGWRGRQTKPKI